MTKSIKSCAKREMKRMNAIVKGLRVISASKMSICFLEFANNYYKDGIYFFNKKKYIESFEAFIISWAYIDAGLKLKFFQAPKEQKEWFTA